MDIKNRDGLLGALSAFGIIFIWKLCLGNFISIINIGFRQNINLNSIFTLKGVIIFQIIPILLIAFILCNQFKLSKNFNTYYIAALLLMIIVELFYAFYT